MTAHNTLVFPKLTIAEPWAWANTSRSKEIGRSSS
jgi:hypothetical protein